MLYADRVYETGTVTGTGAVTLTGAVAGYQDFSTAFSNGDRVSYTIWNSGSEWETGTGIFTSSGTTLSREIVFASSNGGALVNFSAGTKQVWCDLPALAVADKGLTYAFARNMVRR